MIKKKFFILLTAAGTVFASCVDSNYKLSDLDTTVGISVNNLTLPLTVDSLVLDQVLDLDDDGKVKRDTLESGDIIYAIIEKGSFESDAIEIPSFETKSPEIEPITSVLTRDKSANIRRRKGGIEKDGVTSASYPINVKDFTKFQTSGKVDPSITNIEKIGVNADFGAAINVSENPDLVEKIKYINFEELKMNVPKGLEGTFIVSMGKEEKNITKCYDSATGVLDLAKYKEEYGEELQIKVENTLSELKFNAHVDAIDLTKAGDDMTLENGEFKLNSTVSVAGDIVVYGEDVEDGFTLDDLPNSINYECAPSLSEIVVSEFTGKIKYDIEDINIDPISLNDIPDMLSQDSTDIKLANPQIYIRLNNPLAANNLYAEAGLAMIAKRNDGSEKIVSLGDDKLKMADDYNVFCLTTDGNMPQEKLHSQYRDAVNKKFNGFSDILSGNGANGLPDKIEIDVVEPMIPEQSIKGFELGQTIEKVQGTYLFYAPLALKDETSFVIYQDTLDGWYDETLEKLSIKKLAVKADVNSEIPLKVELSFHPMDVNGKIIKGVRSSSVTLDATDASQRVEIAMEGNIEKLDGIIVRAKLCGADGEPIAPSQSINFKNLKIAVDGSYIDEF